MVSVLALNKLELKDMINAEMVENPVLEELEESVPLLDEVGKKEEDRDRAATQQRRKSHHRGREERSLRRDRFRIVLSGLSRSRIPHAQRDGGHRAAFVREFPLQALNLTDHLSWQLGALSLRREVREAADLIIGNLNEDGYLIASDDELLGVAPPATPEADAETAKKIVTEAQALGIADVAIGPSRGGSAEGLDSNRR